MRRIALPLGRRLFVAVALLAMLVATLPARLAARWLDLPASGVAARAIDGTIWSARAHEVQVGGLALGDVDAGLHPLALLVGRAAIGFADEGEARGVLTVSRHVAALEADRLRLPADGRFAPLPVTGIVFERLRARFRDGYCDGADGTARIELAAAAGYAGLPGSFSGEVRCAAGALAMPLASVSGRERLMLSVAADGRYHAEVTLAPADAATGGKLAALGFRPGAAGYALAFDGRW